MNRHIPRLGVIGSGEGTNFSALAGAIVRRELEAEVVVVISDVESAGILEKARALGVAAHFVDPGPWKTKMEDAAQVRMAGLLMEAGVDLVICAGFMRRLKEPVLRAFAGRILNVHPSLLPDFPGRDGIGAALAAGVSETGCTVHLVNEEIDAGDVLGQERVPVLAGDTRETLRARVNAAERLLYPRVIGEFWERSRQDLGFSIRR